MKYKVAIFDLDGTILNTLEDLTDSLNYCLGKFGFAERTIEEVRCFVGNGIHKLIERAVPSYAEVLQLEAVYEEMLAYYQTHCEVKTRPYDGVPELLLALKAEGVLTAVVSNKADAAVRELCSKYFAGLFEAAVGEKKDVRKKPAPDAVNAIIDQLGIDKCEAVYIGDSEVDIETAKNAGIDCISVDWGFRDRDLLLESGARVIATTPEKVLELIM